MIVGPTPRERIKALIRTTLTSRHGSVDHIEVMSGGVVSHAAVAARWDCLLRVREAFPDLSERHLARIFNLNSATVRRIILPHERARRNGKKAARKMELAA